MTVPARSSGDAPDGVAQPVQEVGEIGDAQSMRLIEGGPEEILPVSEEHVPAPHVVERRLGNLSRGQTQTEVDAVENGAGVHPRVAVIGPSVRRLSAEDRLAEAR